MMPAYMIGLGAWTGTATGNRRTQFTIAKVYGLSKLTPLYADVMVLQVSSGAVARTLGIGPAWVALVDGGAEGHSLPVLRC